MPKTSLGLRLPTGLAKRQANNMFRCSSGAEVGLLDLFEEQQYSVFLHTREVLAPCFAGVSPTGAVLDACYDTDKYSR